MWKRIVQINYESVADHILTNYGEIDTPKILGFEDFHSVLSKHMDSMMSGEVNKADDDEELTNILFEHYMGGHVASTMVTSNPGVVVKRGEHSLMLPLVIIELKL